MNSIEDTVGGNGRVIYRSQTGHSYSQIGDSRGYGARHGSITEEVNQYSLLNLGESVDGDGRSGSRYWTGLSPSHHSGDHSISSDFYSYGDNISGHRHHLIQFSAYNHGGLNIAHPRFPQKYIIEDVHGENSHPNNLYYFYPSAACWN